MRDKLNDKSTRSIIDEALAKLEAVRQEIGVAARMIEYANDREAPRADDKVAQD